jgi:hypothetical protein
MAWNLPLAHSNEVISARVEGCQFMQRIGQQLGDLGAELIGQDQLCLGDGLCRRGTCRPQGADCRCAASLLHMLSWYSRCPYV